MGDCAWVGEVVDSGLFVFCEEDGGREEIVEDGVGVGDVDHALVFGDLGDEVAGVEVIGDRHAESQNEAVGVVLHDLPNLLVIVERASFECRKTNLLDVSLGLRVEGPSKVGLIGLEVARATNWVSIIVGVDAAGSEDSDVNALQEASIGQV